MLKKKKRPPTSIRSLNRDEVGDSNESAAVLAMGVAALAGALVSNPVRRKIKLQAEDSVIEQQYNTGREARRSMPEDLVQQTLKEAQPLLDFFKKNPATVEELPKGVRLMVNALSDQLSTQIGDVTSQQRTQMKRVSEVLGKVYEIKYKVDNYNFTTDAQMVAEKVADKIFTDGNIQRVADAVSQAMSASGFLKQDVLKEMQKQLASLNQTNQEEIKALIKQKMEQMFEKKMKLRENLGGAVQKLKQLQQQITEKEAIIKNIEQQEEKSQKQIISAQAGIERKEQQIRQLQDATTNKQNYIAKLEEEIKKLQENTAGQENAVNNLGRKLDVAQTQIQELTAEKDTIQKLKNEQETNLKKQTQNYEQKAEELRLQSAAADGNLKDQREEAKRLSLSVEFLKTEISNVEKNFATAESTIAMMQQSESQKEEAPEEKESLLKRLTNRLSFGLLSADEQSQFDQSASTAQPTTRSGSETPTLADSEAPTGFQSTTDMNPFQPLRPGETVTRPVYFLDNTNYAGLQNMIGSPGQSQFTRPTGNTSYRTRPFKMNRDND